MEGRRGRGIKSNENHESVGKSNKMHRSLLFLGLSFTDSEMPSIVGWLPFI